MLHVSIQRDVASLVMSLPAIPPTLPMREVAELFLHKEYAEALSLPVVDNGRPVGMMSRYRFMDVYLNKRFGPALYGKSPVSRFMNLQPLVVAIEQPLSEAAHHVTGKLKRPLTEDFIITQAGVYVGIGFVVDLLKAMERELRTHTDALNQAYAQLKSSQLALVQSEKMASLGQMVAGIAHEINTPLGYVKNNVVMEHELLPEVRSVMQSYETVFDNLLNGSVSEEALSEQIQHVLMVRADSNVYEMLDAVNDLAADSIFGISQISELVANLKNFSRMDAAVIDTVNVHDCIESALNIGRNVLKHKVEVVKDFGDVPPICCSPSQINQVFLNLLTNAAQAIDETGRITLKTWFANDAVHITVTDTGKGILADNLARIFDPFFTTKPVGEGTGLGLAISYQIIQQHGGEIYVTSELGVGTCFHLSLPLTPTEI